jgi:lipopolysaccharide/colanic/teichoic acid biosynthesis glycosyltransferase
LAWSGEVQPRLLSKAQFFEHARREQLRAVRTKSEVSLVIVSLDDPQGASPEDLYELAKLLQVNVRETDLLGWYANSALAILLPDTDEQGAGECVQRIQAQAAALPLGFEVHACCNSPFFLGGSPPDAPLLSQLLHNERARLPGAQTALKRLLDICGSSIGIILLSPVMIGAAVAIKATSKGPVIFKQVRLGRDGKAFTFLKFRSMTADADEGVHRAYVKTLIASDSKEEGSGKAKAWFKMGADPRITPVGHFLRRTSIDELPQLFNVLRGDMSLVGPRPPIPYEVESYSAWHIRRILEVKPGITGLWQAEGRGVMSFDDMVRLDLQYARHWTLLMDTRILLKTVKVVLQRRGAA